MNPSGHPRIVKIKPEYLRPLVEDIAWCDYSEIFSGHHNALHLHHFHQLDVVLEGEFTLTLENGETQVGYAGDAWVIPPLIWHGVDCQKPFRWCSCKFHLTPQFWPFFGTVFQRFRVPQYLREGMDPMGCHNAGTSRLSGEHAASVISLCLIEFIRKNSLSQPDDSDLNGFRHALWPLLEEVQLAPGIHWGVTMMAAKMGLSPDHFTRCFKRIIGQTPQQYILETAMRGAAANLLKTPAIPIKEIAEMAGYANVHAFTHAFSRILKISPAAYKKQHSAQNLNG